MIGIIDYDAGNLMSVRNSLRYLGFDCVVSDKPNALSECEKLILPGVGAFPSAMTKLNERGLDEFIIKSVDKGIPLLGICLGMQVLFEVGNEVDRASGLGLLKGEVRLIETKYKLPHIGWNSLEIRNAECELLNNVQNNSYMYFVHSYMCECFEPSDIVAIADYGEPITAIVQKGNVFGCQFHPEKSSDIGLKIYENYAKSKM
ncbi:MAG: imidazole glycerol phosphate synthase subunit HisH [Oscillospiraceae bacterium]|jgi:glutamine amidotransferase|nr:imidazole glycerol phosphate synthase subunit HisH [Oscillospiraceae bacterium]